MNAPRTMFRPAALRRHEAAAARTVLLRPAAPRTALFLCVLLALLATGSAVAAAARVPVIAEGWAIVVAEPGQGASADVHVVVLLQSSEAGRLHAGQRVTLEFPNTGRLTRSASTVVSGVMDPAEARRRWPSTPVATIAGATPAIVMLVSIADDSISMVNEGSIGRAEVEVGSRSVGSLLPLVGRFFDG